jgi:hypothetical protein
MVDSGEIVYEASITDASEIATLIPDTSNFRIGVDGVPLQIGKDLHIYKGDNS